MIAINTVQDIINVAINRNENIIIIIIINSLASVDGACINSWHRSKYYYYLSCTSFSVSIYSNIFFNLYIFKSKIYIYKFIFIFTNILFDLNFYQSVSCVAEEYKLSPSRRVTVYLQSHKILNFYTQNQNQSCYNMELSGFQLRSCICVPRTGRYLRYTYLRYNCILYPRYIICKYFVSYT